MTESGLNIELNTALEGTVSPRHTTLEHVNKRLLKWRYEDIGQFLELQQLLAIAGKSIPKIDEIDFLLRQYWPDVNPPFRMTAFVPVLAEFQTSRIQTGYALSASVNKGTIFRIVLEWIIDSHHARGNEDIPLLFVLGSTIIDLPILRPDLEIMAVDDLSEDVLEQREARLHEVVTTKTPDDIREMWQLSVLDHNSLMNGQHPFSPYTMRMLEHDKIVRAKDWGLYYMLLAIKEKVQDILDASEP